MPGIANYQRLSLHADTAADLMVSDPVSLRADASLHEALVLFTKKRFSAAPVIDSAGRPVGVVSLTDIVIHDRTRIEWNPSESQGADADATQVADMMTPAVFCVSPTARADTVIAKMLGLDVRRLFVVDEAGVLLGVISARDIIRCLREDGEEGDRGSKFRTKRKEGRYAPPSLFCRRGLAGTRPDSGGPDRRIDPETTR